MTNPLSPITLALPDGGTYKAPVRWRGAALAVHAPLELLRVGKQPRGVWCISSSRFGLLAGTYRGKIADAVKLARAWDAAFAAALVGDRCPSLSAWEHAQQWGRQCRGDEPATGPDAAAPSRRRAVAADDDGGEQFPATPTMTPAGPGRVRYSRVLPDGRARLRNPETGKPVRMRGDIAAFKSGNPLEPVFRLWWDGAWVDVPTLAALHEWTFDSRCETPDGRIVEPDAPDSWLSLLGLV
jgi:hypothetical protein